MTDELELDHRADVVRRIVAARAPRSELDYADWTEDSHE